jgi:hypothetical protein
MEFVCLNPKPLLVISFVPLYMFYWWFIMVANYHQHTPYVCQESITHIWWQITIISGDNALL